MTSIHHESPAMSTCGSFGKRTSSRTGQRGIAMVVVLLLLMAITGIAVFSARNASFGETAARNQLDSELARQAAESALRDAERDLLLADGSVTPTNARCSRGAARPLESGTWTFTAACKQGQCDKLLDNYQTSSWVNSSTNAEPWWPEGKGGLWGNANLKPAVGVTGNCNFDGSVPIGTFTGIANIPGVAAQPEYLIEQFTRGRDTYYRITARGFGLDERTQVILQTYFRPFTVQ